MAVFNYKAREKDGAIVSGTIEAAERRLAMQRLQAKGLSPVTLKEVATGAPSVLARLGERAKALRNNRSEKDGNENSQKTSGAKSERVGLLILKRLMELTALVYPSATPSVYSVNASAIRSNVPLRKSSGATSEGSTLAGAMSRQTRCFPSSISYVIEAGEATGNLGPILSKVIDYLEEKEAIRKKMVAVWFTQPSFAQSQLQSSSFL